MNLNSFKGQTEDSYFPSRRISLTRGKGVHFEIVPKATKKWLHVFWMWGCGVQVCFLHSDEGATFSYRLFYIVYFLTIEVFHQNKRLRFLQKAFLQKNSQLKNLRKNRLKIMT